MTAAPAAPARWPGPESVVSMTETEGTQAVGSPIDGRLDSVFVSVRDVIAAREWYGRLLGLPVRPEHTYFGHLHVFKLEGGVDLLLDSKDFRPRECSPVLCMFPTADIDAAYVRAELAGAEIVQDIERVGSVAWFTFKDPDGNVHMVFQRPIIHLRRGRPSGPVARWRGGPCLMPHAPPSPPEGERGRA
jgi:predicted enzyme related to lactoylglutathione lyase